MWHALMVLVAGPPAAGHALTRTPLSSRRKSGQQVARLAYCLGDERGTRRGHCGGIAVANYTSTLTWYERLIGKPPEFLLQEGEAVWLVTEHGRIYMVADAKLWPGNAPLTLLVEELTKQVERGVPVRPIDATTASVQRTTILDRTKRSAV